MGDLFHYFSAPSDQDAASALHGGPSRLPEYADTIVPLGGIDPAVQLGTLEQLLTGVDRETLSANPRSGKSVAGRNGGAQVCTLSDELQAALAGVEVDGMAEVVVPWSESEEFGGMADPETLAGVLAELSMLASAATARGEPLYCWASR